MPDLMVPLEDRISYPFYPKVPAISLELTNHCNLTCPYCANISLTRPKTYIEWSLLEKIVDECAERGFNLAYLHGVGEPLLWDRLEEVVSLIKRKRAGMGSFGTNGTLLHPERVRSLLDAGLENIYVSIDTLDPEIYKATRGGKLEKVVRNVQEMIRIAPKNFLITIALMNHKDHRITQSTIDKFHEVFGRHENVSTNLVENQLFPSAPGDYRIESSQLENCYSPVNYLFIALDGRAAICCMDQDVIHSLGSVTERSIHDIWYDQTNQTIFRNIALGVKECPEACTKHCVLKKPKQDVSAVKLGFGVPYEEAARLANIFLMNSRPLDALPIVETLFVRDPTNQSVRGALQQLRAHMKASVAAE